MPADPIYKVFWQVEIPMKLKFLPQLGMKKKGQVRSFSALAFEVKIWHPVLLAFGEASRPMKADQDFV